MDISNNETFREISANLQRIIDINTAQYRRIQQRESTGYIVMGQTYTIYLLQNVILEFAIIFIRYLMSLHPHVEANTQEPIQIENPPPPSNPIPSNNRILRDYIFSYTFEPIYNSITNGSSQPTEEQIRQATEYILYDSSRNQTECPITLEQFQEGEQVCRIIPCGHIFKETSLTRWFHRNNRCPVCRYDIRNYQPDHNDGDEEEDEYADLPDLIDADATPTNHYDVSYNPINYNYFNHLSNRIRQQNEPIVNEIVNHLTNHQSPIVNDLSNLVNLFINESNRR